MYSALDNKWTQRSIIIIIIIVIIIIIIIIIILGQSNLSDLHDSEHAQRDKSRTSRVGPSQRSRFLIFRKFFAASYHLCHIYLCPALP